MMGYLGAKTAAGVPQAIIALMPPHDTYIEAFAGTAAVYQAKEPAGLNVLIEKDYGQYLKLYDLYLRRFKTSPESLTVRHADALTLLSAIDVAKYGRLLVYEDPPYLLSTRTSSKRYRHEFSEADHLALATVNGRLTDQGAAVILSGYPSPLYDALYAGWNTREMQAMTRGGVRTEKLWFNFEPDAVHWATFAGKDFTDRQRIKRKAASWARRWLACPAPERQAIIAAMLAADRGDRS